jgi:hypothetical protein
MATQRYRLIAEFVLRDRSQYEEYRRHLHELFRSLDSNMFLGDYLSIEKVEEGEEPKGK